jgi:hypothetical protein
MEETTPSQTETITDALQACGFIPQDFPFVAGSALGLGSTEIAHALAMHQSNSARSRRRSIVNGRQQNMAATVVMAAECGIMWLRPAISSFHSRHIARAEAVLGALTRQPLSRPQARRLVQPIRMYPETRGSEWEKTYTPRVAVDALRAAGITPDTVTHPYVLVLMAAATLGQIKTSVLPPLPAPMRTAEIALPNGVIVSLRGSLGHTVRGQLNGQVIQHTFGADS